MLQVYNVFKFGVCVFWRLKQKLSGLLGEIDCTSLIKGLKSRSLVYTCMQRVWTWIRNLKLQYVVV